MEATAKLGDTRAKESGDSLWDVDHDQAEHRISARRQRIRNRLEAIRNVKKMVNVKNALGYHSSSHGESFPVQEQCEISIQKIEGLLDNGNELVSNIQVAAHHLHVHHRLQREERQQQLKQLLTTEDDQVARLLDQISAQWPEQALAGPTDLYDHIVRQKCACNDLLRKRNELIRVLEMEVKESDDEYSTLIHECHENTSVLASRMENQIQALETLVHAESDNMELAFQRQIADQLSTDDRAWQIKLEQVNRMIEEQLEARLKLQRQQEVELDDLITADAEAFNDTKRSMEKNMAALADQSQFLDALHTLNEERLDYEIHVLRKHEEEVVLVKSEQKRKITNLQDTINKLRQRVKKANEDMDKEERQVQDAIANIRQQLDNLEKQKKCYGRYVSRTEEALCEMVEQRLRQRINTMVHLDFNLQARFMTKMPERIKVPPDNRTRTTSKDSSAKKWQGHQNQPSPTPGSITSATRSVAVTAGAAAEHRDGHEDQHFRKMVSLMVQEAHFLVEDNLSQLVEQIPANEQDLFKLDSILSVIGVTSESQIRSLMDNCRQIKDPNVMLKVIRNHVEKSRGLDQVEHKNRITHKTKPKEEGSRIGRAAGPPDQDIWQQIRHQMEQFETEDRKQLGKMLHYYQQILQENEQLAATIGQMRRHQSELETLLQAPNGST